VLPAGQMPVYLTVCLCTGEAAAADNDNDDDDADVTVDKRPRMRMYADDVAEHRHATMRYSSYHHVRVYCGRPSMFFLIRRKVPEKK